MMDDFDDLQEGIEPETPVSRQIRQEALWWALAKRDITIGQFMTRYGSTLDEYPWSNIERESVPSRSRGELMLFLFQNASAPKAMSEALAWWVAFQLKMKTADQRRFVNLVTVAKPKSAEVVHPGWSRQGDFIEEAQALADPSLTPNPGRPNAEQLLVWRKEHGLTQVEAMDLFNQLFDLHLSRSTWGMWETNRKDLPKKYHSGMLRLLRTVPL